MVNANRHIAVAGEADSSVSSVSASALHIGGPIRVNPGELALAYVSSFVNKIQRFFPLVLKMQRYISKSLTA